MDTNLAAFGIVAAAVLLPGAMPLPAYSAEPATADNTTDRVPEDASTPTGVSHDGEDIRVTAQIRSALLADKSLSQLAQNVNITTNQQAVILRGTVNGEEKDRVETLAEQYAGVRQVDNQLTVKNPT